ncbi:MAG: choice-of-anchor D domain-containing protein, partial [Bacteroidota bacterium]
FHFSSLAQTKGDQTISIAPETLDLGRIETHTSTNGTHSFDVVIGSGTSQTITVEAWLPDDGDVSTTYEVSIDGGSSWGGAKSWVSDAGGETKTVYVRCSPTQNVVNHTQAHIYVHDDDWPTYDYITASVTIIWPEVKITGNSVEIIDGDSSPGSGDNTDFGSIGLGSYIEKTYSIINTKGVPTPVADRGRLFLYGTDDHIDINGTHAADYSVTVIPSTPVAPNNGSTTFTIRFTPSAAGVRNAEISIPNNDSNEDPYNFTITGLCAAPEIDIKGNNNSVSIADGDALADFSDSTRFGNVDVVIGTVTVSYWIHNTGSVDLVLTDHDPSNGEYVYFSGTHAADFSVSVQPDGSIAAGDSSICLVVCNPSAAGVRSATLHIDNNDANEGSYDFAIQGTGVTPEMILQGLGTEIADGDISPSATDDTDFGSINYTSGSNINTFTIVNQGTSTGPLYLTDASPYVSISGAHAGDFSVNASLTVSTINIGSSTTFTITFDPTDIGLREATVSIANNDMDENPI